jgi:WD40 repeat protein
MYTPDNKQLISCADDKTIRMWDTASGSETRKYGTPFSKPLFYFLTTKVSSPLPQKPVL